ncbi:hypothetical protein ASE63_02990 [Bosea sp. Root381]|nr:hypothetical protein ASE63_02990 [Bosea sp. Root381]
MARDAQSSGDPVAAENYFQHAEHYYRILLAAQEQMAQQFGHSFPPNRAFNEDADEGEEESEDEGQAFQAGGPQPDPRNPAGSVNGNGYNPNGGQRFEGEGGEGQSNGQRFDRQPRNNDRNNRRFDRNDRQDRGERRFERGEGGQNAPGGYAPRPDAPRSDIPVPGEAPEAAAQPAQPERRFERPERGPRPERRPRREREPELDSDQADEGTAALPSFLTTPVRVPVAAPVAVEAPPVAAPVETPAEAAPEAAPAEVAVKRPRKRRSPREVMDALGSETDSTPE